MTAITKLQFSHFLQIFVPARGNHSYMWLIYTVVPRLKCDMMQGTYLGYTWENGIFPSWSLKTQVFFFWSKKLFQKEDQM